MNDPRVRGRAKAPKERQTRVAGIFKRGDSYTFRYRDRTGRQRRGSARTLSEAKAWREALRTDLRRGDLYTPSRATFADYADEWIGLYQGRTSGGLRESSRERYSRALDRYAKPFFGHMRLADIEPRHVKRYALSLTPSGLSYNSVRLAVAPVRALLATAVEDGLLRTNPASGIYIPRPAIRLDDEEAPKILSAQQLASLIEATPDEWRLFVRFLAETGLRIGELLGLEWRDIDFPNYQLHVRRTVTEHNRLAPPKTKQGRRTIPIGSATARELRVRRDVAPNDRAPVFPARTGSRLRASNVAARVFKPAARAAGVPSTSFHTLRHTCGSNLFRAGANVKQVQLFLGHATPQFTLNVYLHLLKDDLLSHEFVEKLDTRRNTPARTDSELLPSGQTENP